MTVTDVRRRRDEAGDRGCVTKPRTTLNVTCTRATAAGGSCSAARSLSSCERLGLDRTEDVRRCTAGRRCPARRPRREQHGAGGGPDDPGRRGLRSALLAEAEDGGREHGRDHDGDGDRCRDGPQQRAQEPQGDDEAGDGDDAPPEGGEVHEPVGDDGRLTGVRRSPWRRRRSTAGPARDPRKRRRRARTSRWRRLPPRSRRRRRPGCRPSMPSL